MDNFGLASSSTDTGLLQLSFQIQIERGLDGVWGVKHASIVGPPQSPLEQAINNSKPTTCSDGSGPNPKPSTDQHNSHLDFAKPNRPQPRVHRPKRAHRPTKNKWAWRPKTKSNPVSTQPGSSMVGPALTPSSLIPETSTSFDTPKSDPSSSNEVQNMAIIPHPGEVVTRTWGTSSDWVLELWDGRRLSIPVSLL
ncbi:hypothetical protein FCV25MIE_34522 [Fagus crenata]